MLQRTELTDEQKKAVLKVFYKTDTMKELTAEFIKSFKVLELREDENHDNDHYVIWSSILNRTLRVPVTEIIGGTSQ